MRQIQKIVIISFCFLFVSNCKKEATGGGVPMVSVNLTLYVNNPSYASLNAVGGWMYVEGGVKGIIVYRKSVSEFSAYDRNCTYRPTDACPTVSVDNTNLIAVDSCCGSMFSILDGSIVKGPAALSLKQYNTYYDGNVLRIYN